MATTLEDFSSLQFMKVEGVEKIYMRYQTIVSSIKSKTYNVLDHRKLEVRSLMTVYFDLVKCFLDVINLSYDMIFF